MVDKIDPRVFDPNVWAQGLQAAIDRGFEQSLAPVQLLTIITYEPRPDGRLLITDGHMTDEHPFIWGFMDYAPYYIRLRAYLLHWTQHIQAEIHQVRVASDQFVEVVIADSALKQWMNSGEAPILH